MSAVNETLIRDVVAEVFATLNGTQAKTVHEPEPERGCVEDQPQRAARFGTAAAGAPCPPHSRAPFAQFMGREQVKQGKFGVFEDANAACAAAQESYLQLRQ